MKEFIEFNILYSLMGSFAGLAVIFIGGALAKRRVDKIFDSYEEEVKNER